MSGKPTSEPEITERQRGVDPRPERTRQALFRALLELIQEKRWEHIRVQDVLDRTGIGRSTFYAHFDNKFDLLTAAAPKVFLPLAKSGEDFPDLLSLFEHVAEMQSLLRPLLSQPLWSQVSTTFQSHLASAWQEHLARVGVADNQQAYAADMLAGSIMAVIHTWLADECATPAANVCADFERYGRPIVAIARESV